MAKKIEKTNGVQLKVTCGNCLHLKHVPAFKTVCSQMGIREFAVPCDKFTADFHQFTYSQEFAKILKKTPTNELASLLALINAEITTRTGKYYYGMTIYVKLFGDDFISNYVKCHVLAAKGRVVYVQGANMQYYGMFLKKLVMTETQFLKKLKALASANKIRDPKFKSFTDWTPKNIRITDIADIPTIEDLVKTKPEKTSMVWSVNAN